MWRTKPIDLSAPIAGIWKLSNTPDEYPGILVLEGERLLLKLFIKVDMDRSILPIDEVEHIKKLTETRAPYIHGHTKTAGHVTLFDCYYVDYQSLNSLDPAIARVQLTFTPIQAWHGDSFLYTKQRTNKLRFSIPNLHSILANIQVRHRHEEPRETFTVLRSDPPPAKIKTEYGDYHISFRTNISESHSRIAGIKIETTNLVFVEGPESSISNLLKISDEITQFLSFLCIGRVIGESHTITISPNKEAKLLWIFGRRDDLQQSERTSHHSIALFAEFPERINEALLLWFNSSPEQKLARFLMADTLPQDKFSISKFLAAAQAWEIIGRASKNNSGYDKDEFRDACKEASGIFQRRFGTEASNRIYALISSSNRKSFSDLIKDSLNNISPKIVAAVVGDADKFVSAIVKTRNVLTHMEGKKNYTLDEASAACILLTYKLTVLFCIHECVHIKLPLDNLSSALANNPIARWARSDLSAINY